MRRFIAVFIATVAGLVVLLSFKTAPTKTPPAAALSSATPGSPPASSAPASSASASSAAVSHRRPSRAISSAAPTSSVRRNGYPDTDNGRDTDAIEDLGQAGALDAGGDHEDRHRSVGRRV